jgi:hypothetical protein
MHRESWMSNSKQSCPDWEISSLATFLSGVPQGSVLGSLPFIIFINIFFEAVKCLEIIKKSAHETKIGQQIKTAEDKEKM